MVVLLALVCAACMALSHEGIIASTSAIEAKLTYDGKRYTGHTYCNSKTGWLYVRFAEAPSMDWFLIDWDQQLVCSPNYPRHLIFDRYKPRGTRGVELTSKKTGEPWYVRFNGDIVVFGKPGSEYIVTKR